MIFKLLTQKSALLALGGLCLAAPSQARQAPREDSSPPPTSAELRMDAVLDAMNEAIQDERRSYATYSKVLETLGDMRPFSNIVRAESRHIAALTQLYQTRGIEPPESQWTAANVPTYATRREACSAGVESELLNIAIYDRLLRLELPADVRFVFENLQSASRENHLPAFRRCLAS